LAKALHKIERYNFDFRGEQIENGGRETSPEELLAYWRQEHAEAVEDIRQGIRDIEEGRFRSFDKFDADMRQKYGIKD
jgi:hypothetical protein